MATSRFELPYEGFTHSEEETQALGEALARCLEPGSVVLLHGALGGGKTTFSRGVARGLGVDPSRVRSPSFNIQFTYRGRIPVHHLDLYRLDARQEILDAGLEEAIWDPEAVVLVEWAERLGTISLPPGVDVYLEGAGGESRRIRILRRLDPSSGPTPVE